ncbi:GAF domain-containing protein [Paenibacillus sp. CMAA1364]
MTNSTSLQLSIQRTLEGLKKKLALDFVAVALTDGLYRDIYWRFALGAQSERYKKIAVRMGRGMAGKVLQGNSPLIVTAFPEEVQDEVLEFPIFLVESLTSGVGITIKVPLHLDREPYGVLLVGHRSRREFTDNDITIVQHSAGVLAKLYDDEPICMMDARDANDRNIEGSDAGLTTKLEDGPVHNLLHDAKKAGLTCELLDQRITRLSIERQEEIRAILTCLIQACDVSKASAQLVIGQDELGQTLIEFEGVLHPATQDLFLPVISQLRSLKCDLEIIIELEKQSVKLIIPTRFLLDELYWYN